MFRAKSAAIASLTAVLAVSGCTAEKSDSPELTVMGAASTRVMNEEFSRLSPVPLSFVNAGSSALIQQISDGAPGDVLLTADEQTMQRAVEAHLVEGTRPVAQNTLVMVVPAGNPAGFNSVEDLASGDRVVLCAPQVPCGSVSQELMSLNNLNFAPASLGHSVSDTLGKVTSGEADAGWVYRTDAISAGDAVEVIEIPHSDKTPATVVAAVISTSARPENARELVDFISGPEMASEWQRHGFSPVAQ